MNAHERECWAVYQQGWMVQPVAAIPLDTGEGGSQPSADTQLPPDRRRPAARKPPSAVLPGGDCRPTSGTPPRSGSHALRCSCIVDAPQMAHLCRDTTRSAPVGCRRSCWIQHRGPTANLPGRVSHERDETHPATRGTWTFLGRLSFRVIKKLFSSERKEDATHQEYLAMNPSPL